MDENERKIKEPTIEQPQSSNLWTVGVLLLLVAFALFHTYSAFDYNSYYSDVYNYRIRDWPNPFDVERGFKNLDSRRKFWLKMNNDFDLLVSDRWLDAANIVKPKGNPHE